MDDLLWRHLKTLPAFRALLRAVEARFYQQLDLPRPILDLGCGDGNFAEMTFDEKLDAGIDPWWNPLKKSQKNDTYKLLSQSMGDTLPFPDHSFGTIISNSVLEHIPDIQPVLNDASRVLKPGGMIVITMPSHNFTQNLGGARFFERLGLDGVADGYRRLFNRIARHAHTDSAEIWAGRLAAAGLKVERWQYYFSQGALHALEWGHVQGIPSAISHALTGHWILTPSKENLKYTERWLRPYFEEEAPADGAYILFIARKVADEPIPARLPIARPYPVSNEQSTVSSEPLLVSSEQLAASSETFPSPPAPLLPSSPVPQSPTPNLQSPKPPRSLLAIALLFALGFAFLGQMALANDWVAGSGIQYFAYALISLAAFGWFSRDVKTKRKRRLPAFRLPKLRQITKQRWLVMPAFLLTFLAPTFTKSGHFPFFSLLIWLTGCILGLVALWPKSGSLNLNRRLRSLSHRDWIGLGALFVSSYAWRQFNLGRLPYILNGTEANIGLEGLRIFGGQSNGLFSSGWVTNPTMSLMLQGIPTALFGASTLTARLMSPLVGSVTVLVIWLAGRKLWSPNVGWIAGILLAGSHVHIHYSRLGMTNIWEPLIALLALSSLAYAWNKRSRLVWLNAGIFAGLTPYFFGPAHLIPLILIPIFLLLLLAKIRRSSPPNHTPSLLNTHFFAALLLAFIIALPQLLYTRSHQEQFMERARTQSIQETGWVEAEATKLGAATNEIWQQQILASIFAFNVVPDRSLAYNSGQPLLTTFSALFAILGFGLAIWQWRKPRNAILLSWLVVTIIFAGILLLNPPSSHRFLIAMPAFILLAASALAWMGQRLAKVHKWSKSQLLWGLILISLFATVPDITTYFTTYSQSTAFGDRNSEIADEIAHYLNSLPGDWTAYFLGPPSMYISFPTIAYLNNNFQPQFNLFDVVENTPPDLLTASAQNVFIFLPERQAELAAIQAAYPGGKVNTLSGRQANPLFIAYEVEVR